MLQLLRIFVMSKGNKEYFRQPLNRLLDIEVLIGSYHRVSQHGICVSYLYTNRCKCCSICVDQKHLYHTFLLCVVLVPSVNWFSSIHVLKIAAYLLHRSNLTSLRLSSRYYSNIGYISTYKLVISYETVIVSYTGETKGDRPEQL